MRDFRALLAGRRCWDAEVQATFEERGEALHDCMLQNREELIALCEWIESRGIRSYLEIGTWTGRLVSTLHGLFAFDSVAACDDGWAETHGLSIRVPPETRFFRGDSASEEFDRWRGELGPIDLVLIDANHHEKAVLGDFEGQRRHPHRFLAFHDITGGVRQTEGVRRAWERIRAEGRVMEIVRPHAELGREGSTMGIGIWSATEQP